MTNMVSWKRWVVLGLLAALVVTALAIFPQTSFAQTDDATDQPAKPAAPLGRSGMMLHMRGGIGDLRGQHNEFLAEALGITVEELQAAQQKAHEAMIAKAIDEGYVTQEQADLMAAHHAFMQFYLETDAQSFADALSAAVEAGVITQEQADLLQESQGQWNRRGMDGRGMFERGMDGRRSGDRSNFHPRGMAPERGNRMMPGYQAPTPTPEANS